MHFDYIKIHSEWSQGCPSKIWEASMHKLYKAARWWFSHWYVLESSRWYSQPTHQTTSIKFPGNSLQVWESPMCPCITVKRATFAGICSQNSCHIPMREAAHLGGTWAPYILTQISIKGNLSVFRDSILPLYTRVPPCAEHKKQETGRTYLLEVTKATIFIPITPHQDPGNL